MVRTLALVLAGATALAVPPPAAGSGPGRAAVDRAVTYRATAPYQQHATGVRAGYRPDRYCVFDRVGGTGALGYPHFNHAYDNSTDPAKPTALLYEDDGRGGKRLVGVQWTVYDRDQDPRTDGDRPTMFGVPFKGPHRGNFPGQPVHYALHLWLWKKNPKGRFTTYNPAVTCLPGTTRP
ncbi:hypothetical protein [Streptomyces omiyaensis]|uniref:Secreted protein n=1 Tax=Streptomyces omiyaensis TaxID=68247 RepID=A0ABW7BPJ9_9ACTN|nr:hypothetical protein [Streptomyces omiyaensis]GGY54457.1 hypothetical protein GCM10010363_39570 [Streptomyces omiyaensis]